MDFDQPDFFRTLGIHPANTGNCLFVLQQKCALSTNSPTVAKSYWMATASGCQLEEFHILTALAQLQRWRSHWNPDASPAQGGGGIAGTVLISMRLDPNVLGSAKKKTSP